MQAGSDFGRSLVPPPVQNRASYEVRAGALGFIQYGSVIAKLSFSWWILKQKLGLEEGSTVEKSSSQVPEGTGCSMYLNYQYVRILLLFS